MLLKQRVMDPRQRDDISEALRYTVTPEPPGTPYEITPAYIYHWSPSGDPGRDLKRRTIGEHSRDIVRFTRFYPTVDPSVVVDFEPAPPEVWHEEAKRRWCTEQRIVYLPIYLGDKMDESGFKERLRACTRLMRDALSEHRENEALGEITKSVEDWLQEPELMRLIDAEALRQVEEMISQGRRLAGVAKLAVLKKVKIDLINDLRGGLRNGRIVDPYARYRPAAAAVE